MPLESFQQIGEVTAREMSFLDVMCSPGRKAHAKGAALDPLKGGREPIRLGGKHAFRPKCKPMDTKWKVDLSVNPRMVWYSGNPGFRRQYEMANGSTTMDVWTLRDGLVGMGGEEVCLPGSEPDLQRILTRGQLWGQTDQVVAGGAPSNCHENCAALWQGEQDGLVLATGYALSDDGLWRQHSWCIQPTQSGAITLETTVRRQLYFGFVMGLQESLRFVVSQIGRARLAKGTAPRYGHTEVVPGEPIWFE